MGGKSGKLLPPQTGPIVEIMEKKYPGSTVYLSIWVQNFGFPVGGSFSKTELGKLKNKLKDEVEKMRQKKKVNVRDWEEIERHKKCLAIWEKECEARERKEIQKQMMSMSPKDNEKTTR